MSWRLVLARRRQILLRLGRKDSTDFADQSIRKGGIGRVAPADHEVPGQQRQQPQESEVADVQREAAARRLA